MHQSENASSTSDDDFLQPALAKNQHPEKTKQKLRKHQTSKKKRLRSHNTDEICTLLKCFELTTEEERGCLIKTLSNKYDSIDEQNAYLVLLITGLPKERKRTKTSSSSGVFSYEYAISMVRDRVTNRKKVCHKAFISIFGILPTAEHKQ